MFIVGELCDINYYGYTINYDGIEKNVGSDTTQFNLSSYARENITWSIRSFIDGKSSDENKTTTYLCNFKQPAPPELYSNELMNDIPSGKYKLIWSNPNTEKILCGVNLEYRYNISVSLNGKEMYRNTTTETSRDFEFETGNYNWTMSIFNGISYSSASSVIMSFCVPENIP